MSSLEERGVEFRLGRAINECTEDSFIVGEDNEEIKAGTVVWTGGVTGSSILTKSGFELNRGKVTVDGDLRAPGLENTFILGDCAWVMRSEEHTSELQSRGHIVCRLLLEKKRRHR